jgi:PhnB protein
MKTLNPYLSFAGNCQEALNFYKDAFGGEVVSIQTFGEAPVDMEGITKDSIMHSEFRAEGVSFMASDALSPARAGSGNITLNITLDSEQEQDTVFSKLADGGKVTMPLNDTFWGARFGMLIDKFGISWMLNCEKKK